MATIRRRRSTIGLDYGTHSTKVVHRIRNDDVGRVVTFDTPCEGFAPSVSPSVIRDIGGRLYFGSEAVNRDGGINFGSLKADLINPPDEDCLRQEVEVLTAAYLTWVLQSIFIADPQLKADRPIVQYSAPTAHVGSDDLRRLYERIAHASYKVATDDVIFVGQGVEYKGLFDVFGPLLEAAVPPSSERKFFVLPETVAPIVSLQQQPILETGIYLIADMGASTTEISVLAVNDASFENSILGYHDATEIRGGNELESFQRMDLARSKARIEEFLKCVKKQADSVWYKGFQKDMRNAVARSRWQSLTVLLTGGATLNTFVKRHFEESISPSTLVFNHSGMTSVGRHHPESLICNNDSEDLSLFAVANGLSVERPRWPRFFNENEVNTLEADVQGDDRFALPYYLQDT